MTQHFHFIFGNEIALRLQITEWKTLPQTFHKWVLLTGATHLFSNPYGLPKPFTAAATHVSRPWAHPTRRAEQQLWAPVCRRRKLTGKPGFALCPMFPFVLAPSVLTGFPLGLIPILPSSLLSLEMESGDGYGNLNRNGDAKPQNWQLVQSSSW